MSANARSTFMLDVGQVVGNYKITAKLGEGGMGIVFLAEHPVIGKKVALKAIHPELARNPEVVSRFVMEAKAVNQIGHEHIVDIGDFGTTPNGDFYFIMEYLQGESLADRLKREILLSQSRALAIAAQMADALGASHDHGIIHRDLKPENIFLITRRGNPDFVKVLDFGLAKLTQTEEKVTHKTRAGSVMGTPYYMSPEQGEGKLQIDHRADIYSLGIILFEMLTGKVPFGGEGYGEIIVKHITHQAPSARRINPAISAAVEMILFRALEKERDARFQTMHDFRDALLDPEGYLAESPSHGMPAQVTGITRLAAPMARRDMPVATPISGSGAESEPGSPSGSGSGSGIVGRETPVSSTFRNAVGQVEQVPSVLPKTTGRTMVLGIVGAIALAGVVVVARGTRSSDDARHPSPVVRPVTVAATRPPTSVRVNFTSDPPGATVVRDDGLELGVTPLSTQVPYSDESVKFVLRKEGYDDKPLLFVPNLPAPLFAALQPRIVPETFTFPPDEAAVRRRKVGPVKTAGAPGSATGEVAKEAGKDAAKKVEKRPAKPDEDAVLEPDFK
jgi:serine/threonine protein kinase